MFESFTLATKSTIADQMVAASRDAPIELVPPRNESNLVKRISTVMFLVLLAMVLIAPDISGAIEHPMIGDQAPPFELESLDGDIVRSSDLTGRYIVLHFGAGW